MYLDGFEDVRDIAVEFAGTKYYWAGQENGVPQLLAFNPDDVDMIVAVYEQGGYDGQAFVVYREKADGKLYEVNASHCSCFGLEEQWSPEEVVVEELIKRPSYVYGVDNERIRSELVSALTAAGSVAA